MPAPTSSLATQRPDLAESFMEYDLEMDQAKFIAHKVFPVIEVASQAGNFGKIPLEQLLQNRETKRAPGSGYSRGNWTFDTATYACEEHGMEEPIDDREAQMYREYFDVELISTARAYRAVLENAEKRLAAALFNASTFSGQTTNVVEEWDDNANSVPIDNVKAAVLAAYNRSGLWPNTLIISEIVFRNVVHSAQIVDRLKYQGYHDMIPSEVTAAVLAQVFQLEQVLVAGGTKNTANEGQAANPGQIWSEEYAMVCRTAVSQDMREPCIGRTFHWGEDGSDIGGQVETYRDETIRGDVVRVRHDVDEVTLHAECAQLLDNVTT